MGSVQRYEHSRFQRANGKPVTGLWPNVWQLLQFAEPAARDAVRVTLRILGPLNTLQQTAGKRERFPAVLFLFLQQRLQTPPIPRKLLGSTK